MNATWAPYDLFQWLPVEVREAFVHRTSRRRYAAGQTIYLAGDAGDQMYRLVSGSVRLSLGRADGHEIMYVLYKPGDCFGQSSLIDREARAQCAQAGTLTELQVLDRQGFELLRDEHREFDRALVKMLAYEVRQLGRFAAESHLMDLPSRVASRISTAVDAFGVANDDGIRFSVQLPQSDLALMVGASRQAVNRILKTFKDDGLIAIEYGNLSILEIERLRQLARPM